MYRLADDFRYGWYRCRETETKITNRNYTISKWPAEAWEGAYAPALITSTPDGYHRSPCLKSNRTVLFANVLKYSPSSIWVPSHSKTTRTGSEAGTPSLSLPAKTMIFKSFNHLFAAKMEIQMQANSDVPLTINSSKLPTTNPLRIFRQLSQIFSGLFPRDSCSTQQKNRGKYAKFCVSFQFNKSAKTLDG